MTTMGTTDVIAAEAELALRRRQETDAYRTLLDTADDSPWLARHAANHDAAVAATVAAYAAYRVALAEQEG